MTKERDLRGTPAERVLRLMQKVAAEPHVQTDDDSHAEVPCQCHGTGYLVLMSPRGRTFAACPACTPPEVVEHLNDANLPDKYKEANFSAANILHAAKHLGAEMAEKFLENEAAVMHFCDDAGNFLTRGASAGDRFFLCLMGPVGTGKTHLAVCALKQIMVNQSCRGRFVDFQALLHQIRDAYSRNDSEEDIMRPLRNVPILVIDEFGKGRAESEWEREKLDDIVNSRYNSGRITIITTNYLTPELLQGVVTESLQERSREQDKLRSMLPQNLRFYLDNTEEQGKVNRTETFLTQSLRERIGVRMYDRLLEVARFIDFVGIPSFRRRSAEAFLSRLRNASDE